MAVTDEETVAAWDTVHEALAVLPGWEAVRPTCHGEERLWHAYAHHARHTRARQPNTFVESRGTTEADALRELAAALRVASE
jgi:hypothetical protein